MVGAADSGTRGATENAGMENAVADRRGGKYRSNSSMDSRPKN